MSRSREEVWEDGILKIEDLSKNEIYQKIAAKI